MKNIDRIRKMSAEELAKWKEANFCSKCRNHDEKSGCIVADLNCKEYIKIWLESEAELTADDMFEKLGYKITAQSPFRIIYKTNEKHMCPQEICFYNDKENEWQYEKYYIGCGDNPQHPLYITKKEHGAICKKLEELEEEKENGNK